MRKEHRIASEVWEGQSLLLDSGVIAEVKRIIVGLGGLLVFACRDAAGHDHTASKAPGEIMSVVD